MDKTDSSDVITKFLARMQEQFPDIRPYDMDDWDWTWADEGYQFLEGCDFAMAELTFQRLAAARPRDPDGFEGLAMVYQALGIREQAILMIDEALRLAEKRVEEDALDPEALEDMRMARQRIHEMPLHAPVLHATDEEDD